MIVVNERTTAELSVAIHQSGLELDIYLMRETQHGHGLPWRETHEVSPPPRWLCKAGRLPGGRGKVLGRVTGCKEWLGVGRIWSHNYDELRRQRETPPQWLQILHLLWYLLCLLVLLGLWVPQVSLLAGCCCSRLRIPAIIKQVSGRFLAGYSFINCELDWISNDHIVLNVISIWFLLIIL